jgi:hypothetical protein
MLSGRTELAETRLAVTATQIIERLRLRAGNLQELLSEELSVDSKMLQASRAGLGAMGLDSLEQRMSQIKSAQRRENTECWRDLTHVMRDFLNAWEGFSRNEAKGRFLESLPASKMPQPSSTYHNDHYTNQTKQ